MRYLKRPGWFRTWLRSPWAILGGIVLGGLLGYIYPRVGPYFAPPARIYLGLLRMCILPIMITAVISSLGRIMKMPQSGRLLKRLWVVVSVGLLFTSILGAAAGLALRPGEISESTRADLGRLLFRSEGAPKSAQTEGVSSPSDFFVAIVPVNIFAALAEGHGLQILVFSILLGTALGVVPLKAADDALDLLSALCDAFKKITGWLMVLLPVGLFCIFTDFISSMGFSLFRALSRLILTFYAASLVLLIIYMITISVRVKMSFFRTILSLKESLLVAFATTNSFVAIPTALKESENNLKLSHETTNLVIPLGVVVNRQGVVLVFILVTLFLAQIYGIELSLSKLVMAVTGCALAGMAALGRLGVAASLLAYVLQPLGLPAETAFVILLSMEVLFDPVTAVLIIEGNCAAAAIIDQRGIDP